MEPLFVYFFKSVDTLQGRRPKGAALSKVLALALESGCPERLAQNLGRALGLGGLGFSQSWGVYGGPGLWGPGQNSEREHMSHMGYSVALVLGASIALGWAPPPPLASDSPRVGQRAES